MKLGFMTVKDMRSLPFEEVAKFGAEAGFKAVDTPIDEIDTTLRYGMEVGSTMLRPNAATPDPDERAKAQDELCALIDRAVAKGVKRGMIIHARQPGMTNEESVDIFAKGFGPVAEYAEQFDFKLVMEIYHAHGRWLAITPELIRAVFAAVPSRALGICLDPSHFVVQGIDYMRATREFAERIYYAHAKDTEILPEKLYEYGVFGKAFEEGNSRPFYGWWRYRLPGYGEIDWPKFIATLVECGYDDILAVEHEDAIYYGDVEKNKKGLMLAKQYLEPFMA